MKTRSLTLSLLIPVLLVTACKKDKDNDTPGKTRTELIATGSWKFEKATSSGINVTSSIPGCWIDNVVKFESMGTGSLDEGADICEPSSEGSFTWAFETNETMLNITGKIFPTASGMFTIVSLNETRLAVSQVVNIPSLGNRTVVFAFIH